MEMELPKPEHPWMKFAGMYAENSVIDKEKDMNHQKLKLSTLEGLTTEQITEMLNPVISASLDSPNGSLQYLQNQVRSFESKYNMSSEEMMQAVASANLPETEAIATWGMSYSLLQNLSSERG